jgi:integrase
VHVAPDDYVFTTPEGTPIDANNFYKREWLPMIRRLNISPRPFYNTRHSYTSFMLSSGAKSAFVSAQTADSIKTLEAHYAKYIPDTDMGAKMVEKNILESVTLAEPRVSELAKQLSPAPP